MPDVRVCLQRSRQKVASTWNHGCSHKVTKTPQTDTCAEKCASKRAFSGLGQQLNNDPGKHTTDVGDGRWWLAKWWQFPSFAIVAFPTFLIALQKRAGYSGDKKLIWTCCINLLNNFFLFHKGCILQAVTLNNIDVDEHDWCSCALRRGCALCLPAPVRGRRQSSQTKFELIDQRAVRLPLRIHTYLSLGGLQTLESSSLSSSVPSVIFSSLQVNNL